MIIVQKNKSNKVAALLIIVFACLFTFCKSDSTSSGGRGINNGGGVLNDQDYAIQIYDVYNEKIIGPDTIYFANDSLISWGSIAAGFEMDGYEVDEGGDSLYFEALTVSPSLPATMLWRGIVIGNRISGEIDMRKDEKRTLYYSFEGHLIE
ncbi:MAG: hypothetical protein IIA45_07410 [Bacteroidetes bacterium]|nr:hypothetical protein [Bacteroidota bacterium]